MNNPKISLIAAIASGNRALGKDNVLIYKIPEDLKRFKEITSGHVIIMGRKTFESIGRPLPNRTNIVITRDPNFVSEGIMVVNSLEQALKSAESALQTNLGDEEVFIIGGGQIFQESISLADRLYLTLIEDDPKDADVFFPEYADFKKVINEEYGEYERYKYRFLILEKS